MKLIRRTSWGAQYGRGPANITPGNGGAAVHYVGGGKLTGIAHSKCAARVRSIEDHHVNGNGWQGIAYNFLACEHGYVFEGRGLRRRSAAQGTNSGNQNYYAVCALIGDRDTPGDTLKSALRDAIDYMRKNGAGANIRGHRQFHSTSCLPLDSTEVLTRRGWIRLGDVTSDDHVASWAMDSGIVTFDPPAGIVTPYEADTMRVDDFESTPDHNWVTFGQRAWAVGCSCGYESSPASIRSHGREGRKRGEAHKTLFEERWKLVRADELRSAFRYLGAVASGGPGLDLTDEQIRLLVWLQGDGHIMVERRGRSPNPYGVEWHLSKPRKVERLAGLLHAMEIPYQRNERANGSVSLRVYGDVAREQIISLLPHKRFHWGLLDLSQAQAEVFLAELMHVDGCEAGSYYSSADDVNLDVVQAISTLNGRIATRGADPNKVMFRRYGRNSPARRDVHKLAQGRRTTVGCLTTVNGTLIVRQNGRTLIIGNCPGDPLYAWVRAGASRPGSTPTTPQEDDVPTYVSIDKTGKSRHEQITGDWQQIYFDANNSAGADRHHGDGDWPSLVKGGDDGADFDGEISLRISGLPEGARGQIRAVEVVEKGQDWAVVEPYVPAVFVADEDPTPVKVPVTGHVNAGNRLRVEVKLTAPKPLPEDATPTVVDGQVRLQVWGR